MKVIIAGGRKFKDYELVKETLDKFKKENNITEIVSGKANGADSLGEKYAKDHDIIIKEFPAKWNDIEGKLPKEVIFNAFGKKYWINAGFRRNEEMAEYADCLIAFWDKQSNGTKNMISLAKKYNLKVIVINY